MLRHPREASSTRLKIKTIAFARMVYAVSVTRQKSGALLRGQHGVCLLAERVLNASKRRLTASQHDQSFGPQLAGQDGVLLGPNCHRRRDLVLLPTSRVQGQVLLRDRRPV